MACGRHILVSEEVAQVRRNVMFYRLMAYVTGVVLIVLCLLAVAQPVVDDGAAVNAVGTTHGILYIIYLGAAYTLARRLRLALAPTVLLLLAGTIPVLTFVVERHITHRYIEPALEAGAGPRPATADAARPAG
jgi:integral membrane protein